MTGARSGIFNPGNIAEKEIGKINWGEAMAYFHRRFGPSNIGSDPYKEIACWTITTPIKGLHLTLTVAPHATWLLFGYLVDKDLNKTLHDERQEHNETCRNRFGQWCVKQYGHEPPTWNIHDTDVRPSPEALIEIQRIGAEYHTAYIAANPDPWAHAEDSLIGRCEGAIARTLRDLRRTVDVRDQDISIHGSVTPFRSVQPSDLAGVAPPAFAYSEEFWPIYAAVHKLGGGKKGAKALVAAIEKMMTAKS